jgi:hypothetical protein
MECPWFWLDVEAESVAATLVVTLCAGYPWLELDVVPEPEA